MDIVNFKLQPGDTFLAYSREELLTRRTMRGAGIRHLIPAELRRRPRGSKVGARLKTG